MKITYDPEADAAYIQIADAIAPGEAARQHALIDTPNGTTQLTLDFSAEGQLLGIEVLSASQGLPADILERAELP